MTCTSFTAEEITTAAIAETIDNGVVPEQAIILGKLKSAISRTFRALTEAQITILVAAIRREFERSQEDTSEYLRSLQTFSESQFEIVDEDAVDRVIETAAPRFEGYNAAFERQFIDVVEERVRADWESYGELRETLVGDLEKKFENGVEFDNRGETREVKQVYADGSTAIEEKTIKQKARIQPDDYVELTSRTNAVEARNIARVETFKGLSAIPEVMWVAVLDERTDPHCARLHGTEWAIGGIPFYPPIHVNCRCQLRPRFDPRTKTRQRQRSQELYVKQREAWFVNYDRFEDSGRNDWIGTPVDVDDHDLDSIYANHLPAASA